MNKIKEDGSSSLLTILTYYANCLYFPEEFRYFRYGRQNTLEINNQQTLVVQKYRPWISDVDMVILRVSEEDLLFSWFV